MGKNAGYFNKANQLFYFLFSFKKIASKIDKHVMLSYLLSVQKTPWIGFFLIPSKIPTVTSQTNSLKFAAFAYYHREKPNLKSLS